MDKYQGRARNSLLFRMEWKNMHLPDIRVELDSLSETTPSGSYQEGQLRSLTNSDAHLSILKVDHQTLVFGSRLVALERVCESFCSNDEREISFLGSMDDLLKNPLKVCRPPFVQPERGSIFLSVQVRTISNQFHFAYVIPLPK